MGIYTYVKVVRRAADFFAVLFLMSMSNMVSNFYGGALDREVATVTLPLPLPLPLPLTLALDREVAPPKRTRAWMPLRCRGSSAVEAP